LPNRLRNRSRMNSLCTCIALIGMLLISGCRKSADAVPDIPKVAADSKAEENLLSIPITQKDVGLIELGKVAKATFSVANLSQHELKLKLGAPSCNCANVELSKDRLAPGESAELTMIISSVGESGPQAASVTLSTVPTGRVWTIISRAILEGLEWDDYVLRLPLPENKAKEKGKAQLEKRELPAVRGRLTIGRQKKQVEILRTVLEPAPGKGTPGIEFGEPRLSRREDFEEFSRYWVELPVHRVTGSPLQKGKYRFRVTFRIDDKLGETGGNILIVPIRNYSVSKSLKE